MRCHVLLRSQILARLLWILTPATKLPTVSPYISQQYSFFPSDMVTSYNEQLLALVEASFDEETYGSILEPFPKGEAAYSTHIQGGWPGCAAVLVCKDCGGAVAQPPDFSNRDPSHQCKLHEDY